MSSRWLFVVSVLGIEACAGPGAFSKPQRFQTSGLPVSIVTPNVTISASAVVAADGSLRGFDLDSTPQQPPHVMSCPTLPVQPADVKRVANDGGLVVRVKVPQLSEPLYGVLALCAMDESARGPASRAYRIQVPDEYINATDGGRATVVYEEVESSQSGTTSWQLYLARESFPGVAPPEATPAAPPASEGDAASKGSGAEPPKPDPAEEHRQAKLGAGIGLTIGGGALLLVGIPVTIAVTAAAGIPLMVVGVGGLVPGIILLVDSSSDTSTAPAGGGPSPAQPAKKVTGVGLSWRF